MARGEASLDSVDRDLSYTGSIGSYRISREAHVQIYGQEESDDSAVAQTVARLKEACPLAGACALSATCEKYQEHERSPLGWMHDYDEYGVQVVVTDDATICPNPNAHIEVVNGLLAARGDEQISV